jgi:hypothetical protein
MTDKHRGDGIDDRMIDSRLPVQFGGTKEVTNGSPRPKQYVVGVRTSGDDVWLLHCSGTRSCPTRTLRSPSPLLLLMNTYEYTSSDDERTLTSTHRLIRFPLAWFVKHARTPAPLWVYAAPTSTLYRLAIRSMHAWRNAVDDHYEA